MSDNTLSAVFAEMRRARELHGENFMGNLKRVATDPEWALDHAIESGLRSKKRLEDGELSKFDVLMEEVGELAQDIRNGYEAREELTQVAAMALAWLGVDPDIEAADDIVILEEGDRPIFTTMVHVRREDLDHISKDIDEQLKTRHSVGIHHHVRIVGVVRPPRIDEVPRG